MTWLLALTAPLLGTACAEDACRPGTVCTLAGTGDYEFNGDGHDGVATTLYLPIDATMGPDGQLYILDWNNHRIRVLTHQGTVETVAGTGEVGDGPDGPALEAALDHPTHMIFDPLGRMIIATWHNGRIKRLDPSTGLLETTCGTGERAYGGDGGPARDAALNLPVSVALDASGSLLIMDQANQVIRRVDADGTIGTLAGRCLVGACAAGEEPISCPGEEAKMACGLADNPEVCSYACQPDFAGHDGDVSELRMSVLGSVPAYPAGRLAVDPYGAIYFTDTYNHRVGRIDPDGMVSTVAGNGTAGFAGDGGPAVDAQLDTPRDVAIGKDGTVYIADTYNSCVRAVSPAGVITTAAGICGERGFAGDGRAATEALFNRPYGIEVDAEDNLYIVDTHNHRVRLVQRGADAS